jgi:hypothetical protein
MIRGGIKAYEHHTDEKEEQQQNTEHTHESGDRFSHNNLCAACVPLLGVLLGG